jgi:hypothetical protein
MNTPSLPAAWTADITLKLASDAEPGTGLGTELVNDFVPRDTAGRPHIPASHLKGLARDAFRAISAARRWPEDLEHRLFGRPSNDAGGADDGDAGIVRFPSLRTRADLAVSTVARTAIEAATGTVAAHSLRTTERVHAGTSFHGRLHVAAHPDSLEANAIRLTLLSIVAVGGGRNRGCGRCALTIDGEKLLPSKLLKTVDAGVHEWTAPTVFRVASPNAAPLAGDSGVLLELTFAAETPVCCPTTPLTELNVISSGFMIPASAVQGAILTMLSRVDDALATACHASPAFRAWPLLPCAPQGMDPERRSPVQVSFTHRVSKLPLTIDGRHAFSDSMIEPLEATRRPADAPLKAADGVLLTSGSGVSLWKASDMQQSVAAHVALQRGEPDLFTVTSMAPMVFRGWLCLPERARQAFMSIIEKDPSMAFGRGRTVRGHGTVTVRVVGPASGSLATLPAHDPAPTVFIAQSPLAVPVNLASGEASSSLAAVVEASGWGKVVEAHGTIIHAFGWNRHGLGRTVRQTSRLASWPAFEPGSVFRLERSPRELATLLLRGVGEGRERGFGAVVPHPGVATMLERRDPPLVELKSRDEAGRISLQLIDKAKGSGLSPSQISQIAMLAGADSVKAKDYLRRQRTDRPADVWNRWEPCFELLNSLLDAVKDRETIRRALEGWKNHAVANRGMRQ